MSRFIIQTRTPIWTGDVNRETKHPRETGIMGSMRWWYEALVRGFDGSACDPTKEGFKCPPEKQPNHWCDACHLFGTTGWARQFIMRVKVKPGDMQSLPRSQIEVPLTEKGWYLPPGLHGEFGLTIQELRGSQVGKWIKLLLKLQANWGAIGAKSYLGYGVFDLKDEAGKAISITEADCQQFIKIVTQSRETRRPSFNMAGLPNLCEMFFCKITFEIQPRLQPHTYKISPPGIYEIPPDALKECFDSRFLPTAAHVRYCLRNLFRGTSSPHNDKTSRCGKNCKYCSTGNVSPFTPIPDDTIREFRHHILGKPGQDEKEGSKIAISHLYKIDNTHWQMRIWGRIPTEFPEVEYEDEYGERYTGIDAILQFLWDAFEDADFWENCFGCPLDISDFVCFYGDIYNPMDLLIQLVSD